MASVAEALDLHSLDILLHKLSFLDCFCRLFPSAVTLTKVELY
jgi:hypothetical protein